MNEYSDHKFPVVPLWQIDLLRFFFLLIAVVMGSFVWYQILFESAGWWWERGLSKSMLGALALLSLWGVRYPLQMLPLMVFELVWKTVWIMLIALPAWLSGRMTADIEGLFYDCVGVVVVYFAIPWRYVFARFFAQPAEPWRNRTAD
jgi:hypothetical protein